MNIMNETTLSKPAWQTFQERNFSWGNWSFGDDGYSNLSIADLPPLFDPTNSSQINGTVGEDLQGDAATDAGDVVAMAITSTVLGIVILATVIGNVFVIAAILLERNLQSVANYLILSLAVADLMVACLVMPFGAIYEVNKQWTLGPELCDMWTSCDVLCCTASILHLVAIAVDRFWAVTNVDYITQRNSQRIGIMIGMVWVASLIVSLAPMFGWKDPDYLDRVHNQKKCLVSQDLGYQVFATCATFYVPLTIILLLYWRIFQAARKRIRRKVGTNARNVPGSENPKAAKAAAKVAAKAAKAAAKAKAMTLAPTGPSETTAFTTISSSVNTSPEKSSSTNGSTSQTSHMSDMSRMEMLPKKEKVRTKESSESKREKKAAKTLAIITGAFVMCWLPFFVTALLMPICSSCYFSDTLMNFFLWLGYFNSTLNPIIYTIFSPEFRNAFKRILFGKHSRHYRPKR